jgi:glycosyltransferase involved in cell wall biosynthesis
LVFGALRPGKRVDTLIRAIPMISCAPRLEVLGEVRSKSYRKVLEREAAGIEDQVELNLRFATDHETDAAFRRTDAVVLAYEEAFKSQSGVLHLALAHRRPVVVTPGAMSEVVTRFGCGAIAADSTPDSIAAAVSRLLEPTQYASAALATAAAAAELTPRRMALATAGAYRSALGGTS